MRRGIVLACVAVLAGAWVTSQARAQEPPALQRASGDEKARLLPLIEGAKKEGVLSYWDTIIQPETNDALAAAFRKHYGLPASFKVNYTLSVTTALITRVDQELNAGQVTIDVGAVASPTWVFELIAAGHIQQYASPEYAHYKAAFDGGLGQNGYFAFNGAYMFVPMWSEDHLKFSGKSYKDVITAVPPGRLSVGDATKSATYLATFHGQRQLLGDDFFRELAKRKPPFPLRSELIAARLVSGEDLMAWSGMPTRAYQYNQKGGKLKFMMPEEGVVMMPQSMFALAKAPHPNAAKLWIDFVLSEEGQSILVKGEALMSGRAGFKSPMPEYAPAIDSLKLIKMDWKGLSTEQMKKVRADWTAIFNP
ncbi:MAG: ABC transporter substrate-binding protein [Variibacter sp.]|nr:ABC transporter substrate-binding protein [Variibacter sp.]